MPPLRLFTSTVFQDTGPGYFTSRIARPKLVTYGPLGSWMISDGLAAPSSVARAHTKLLNVEPGSYGSVKFRLRPSDGWILRDGSRVASFQPGRSRSTSAMARMSPLRASITMTRPPPAFASRIFAVRCRSAISCTARSIESRTSWPASPGTKSSRLIHRVRPNASRSAFTRPSTGASSFSNANSTPACPLCSKPTLPISCAASPSAG